LKGGDPIWLSAESVAARRPSSPVSQKMASVICVEKKSFLKKRRKKIRKNNPVRFLFFEHLKKPVPCYQVLIYYKEYFFLTQG
jgi:hypothetical protein